MRGWHLSGTYLSACQRDSDDRHGGRGELARVGVCLLYLIRSPQSAAYHRRDCHYPEKRLAPTPYLRSRVADQMVRFSTVSRER
jgi:hypothetical protein